MTVKIITLGCKVNQYESQAMLEALLAAGFTQAAPDEAAGVVVVNSCTVTAQSDHKVRQALRRAKKDNPGAVTVLTGCMPQAFPDAAAALLEADIVLGNTKRSDLVPRLQEFLATKQRVVDIEDEYKMGFITDGERYRAFLRQVCEGKAALHTDTLYPYDVIAPILQRDISAEERRALDTTWKALPDYAGGGNALVVADGSGSMYWEYVSPVPAAVALSLAIYFAQRNTGAFRNHFITFSHSPRLVEIKGEDLYEQVHYCAGFNECANTNLQAVFDLLLRTAVENHMS